MCILQLQVVSMFSCDANYLLNIDITVTLLTSQYENSCHRWVLHLQN